MLFQEYHSQLQDTLKLFLRFIKEEKGILLNSFYIRDFKRELVIEFLEWYRNSGAGISAANQRLAALKTFSDYAQLENIEYIAPLQNVSGIKAKKAAPKEVAFLTVEQMSSLINSPDINSSTGFRHRVILTLLYDSGCRVQELCDITIADVSLGSVATVRLHGKGNKYRTVVLSEATAKLVGSYLSRIAYTLLEQTCWSLTVIIAGLTVMAFPISSKNMQMHFIKKMQHFRNMCTAICFGTRKQCICWRLASTSSISEIFSDMKIFLRRWST